MKELPGAAYTGEAFFRTERETVFRRNWVHVAGGHDLRHPGDAFPTRLAGLPIVLVRQHDSSIKGFHNVCRHRGCLLVTESQHARRLLSCKFHAWAYGLDGQLLRTPYWNPADGTADPAFDPAQFSLVPVATATWCDQIFVRLADDGENFDDTIAPLARRWAAYDLSLLRYGFHVHYEVAANWKLVVQNFLDTYHLPFLHPQLGDVAQAKAYDDINEAETAIGICYRAGGIEKDKGDLGMPLFPNLPPDKRAGQDIIVLYPCTLIEMVAGHVLFIRIDPVGPGLTREVMSGYFVGEAATDPNWAEARDAVRDSWDRLNQQDFAVVTAWHDAQISPAAADQPEISPVWEQSGALFRARIAREVADARAVPMKVAVTGAAGMLGRYVIAAVSAKYEIAALDMVSAPGIIQVDVLDPDAITDAMRGCNAVIHLAGLDQVRIAPEHAFFATNAAGSWNVIAAAERLGMSRAVLCSSVAALGLRPGLPPLTLPIPIDHPLCPVAAYGISKQAAEIAAAGIARRGRLTVICLRPALITYPHHVAGWAHAAAAADGALPSPDVPKAEAPEPLPLTRAFVGPEDAGLAFLAALQAAISGTATAYVTAQDTMTVRPTIETISATMAVQPVVADHALYARHPRASPSDIEHTRRLLGWRPRDTWADIVSRQNPA